MAIDDSRRRPAQMFWADKCGVPGRPETTVRDVIARRSRDRRASEARVRATCVAEARAACGELERLRERVRADGEVARLTAIAAEAGGSPDGVRASAALKQIAGLPTRIRRQRQQVEKMEQELATWTRECEDASDTSLVEADYMMEQMFNEGYHVDIWAGKESFLPPGVPCYQRL
jgi:hypothetical protein